MSENNRVGPPIREIVALPHVKGKQPFACYPVARSIEEIDCFVPDDRLPENTRAGVTGYSGRSTTSTTGYAAKRWSDDPWSGLRMGEAEAWRAGWGAAKGKASDLAWEASQKSGIASSEAFERDQHKEALRQDGAHREIGELWVVLCTMEPPA